MTIALLIAAGPGLYRVEGEAWFRFRRDGRPVYARSARLGVQDGRLVGPGGAPLWPEVEVPALEFTVEPDGTVRCGGAPCGIVQLAYFVQSPAPGADGLASSPERPAVAPPRTGVRILREGAPAATPAPNAPAGWVLRPSARVAGPAVLLADVVEGVSGPAAGLAIAPSPAVGVELVLDAARIEAKVRAAGLAPTGWQGLGKGSIRVARASQPVPHAEFAAAALKAVAAQSPGAWAAAGSMGDYLAPVGALELRAERVALSGRTASVVVAVYVDGSRHNSRTVRLAREAANLPARGSSVLVRVMAGPVVVEARGTVSAVDSAQGLVTVKVAETGAHLTGTVAADGAVEVRR